MDIVIAPNPVLRVECDDIVVADEPNLVETAEQMAKLLYEANGAGLAAPQVGITKKLIVVDCDYSDGIKNPMYLVNPKIEATRGEKIIDEEGCLSIPGITIEVARPEDVTVSYLDLDGNPQTIDADGFTARCLQHEIDHLHGITLFETLPVRQRIEKLEEYKAALDSGAAEA